jgi:hypothetical protein
MTVDGLRHRHLRRERDGFSGGDDGFFETVGVAQFVSLADFVHRAGDSAVVEVLRDRLREIEVGEVGAGNGDGMSEGEYREAKAEAPKAEGRMKVEDRNPKPGSVFSVSALGLLISAFLRPSAFGFRICTSPPDSEHPRPCQFESPASLVALRV